MFRKLTEFAPGKRISGRRTSTGALVPAVVLLVGLLFGANQASAQYVTNGTGGGAWTSTTTWAGGKVPGVGNNVTIAGNDSVWTDPTQAVNCANLTIQTGGKLQVLGSGIDMTGAFSIEAGGWYINSTDSAKAWPAGASMYTIDPQSNFVLGSAGNSTLGWDKSDSTFGNVYIQTNLSGGVSCGANLMIDGNLVIDAGQGKYFRGISSGVYTGTGLDRFVHTVKGNVTVISGNWAAVDMGTSATVPLYCTWNIDGNVTVGVDTTATRLARFSPITSEDDAGAQGIFNIKGNLTFQNGGRLAAGSNSSSNQSPNQIAQINVGGNLTFDSTAYQAVNSMGNFIINFNGKKPQTVTLSSSVSFSSSSTTCTLWDTVAAGSNVTFTGGTFWRSNNVNAPNGPGAFVVKGTLNMGAADTIKGLQKFILEPGATLGIASPGGIVALTDATPNAGCIQTDSGRVFSAEANYVYNGSASQVTGSGLPDTVNNLTIDNPDTVTLSQALVINGTLDLKAGLFDNTIGTTLGPNGKVVNDGGKVQLPLAVVSVASTIPKEFSLAQNYPNPFNPTTEIQFSVPKKAHVTLSIYNDLGQKVATLVNDEMAPGVYRQIFNGSRYASGLYFARLVSGSHMMTVKMLMIK